MTTKEESKKYIEAVGRRKTSSARVRITPASKTTISINEKDLADYFKTAEQREIVKEPFTKGKVTEHFKITVKVVGGGSHSQAEAVRHGISRAIIEGDKDQRIPLKRLGFLKRDPRVKERRKFGLKKARKAPQWSKR